MLAMNRRQLIRTVTGSALGYGLAGGALGCASTTPEPVAAPQALPAPDWLAPGRRELAPVIVDPAREIRTVVGLRPFRVSGYRVEAEKLGDKVLVHNYGHGGAGVTLSWGTAHLAVEHALETEHRRAAVIGCGAVGLATARLLQRRGWRVTIYARDLPPNTTSNIAGAQWSPHLVSDPGRGNAVYTASFNRAAELAHRHFQELPGPRFGIRWLDNYFVSDGPQTLPAPGIAHLFPDTRRLNPADHPFPRANAFRYTTMLIEPTIYMPEMMRDFRLAEGALVVRAFSDPAELLGLEEPVIVNCTGLGARQLFDDDEMIPVKGQLTFLLPQPEVDYMVIGGELYMFPRQDGILLGGTHQRGVETMDPSLAAKARILEGHRRLFGFGSAAASA